MRPQGILTTVDTIIELDAGTKIVLIERKNEPYGWALPGGFVDAGESLSQAARRESMEETCLDVHLTEQFFTYSKPGRDKRSPVISTVFIGMGSGKPVGADDAKNAKAFDIDQLPPDEEMAFDHGDILSDYLRYRREGVRPGPSR